MTAIGLFGDALGTVRTDDSIAHVDLDAARPQFAGDQNGIFFADVADGQFNIARLRHNHKVPNSIRLIGVAFVGSINRGTHLTKILPQCLFTVHTLSIKQNANKKKPLELLEGYKKRRV